VRDEREMADPVMDRLVTELRVLPQVRPGATQEVLARLAAQQASGPAPVADEADVIPLHRAARRRVIALPWVGLLAVAATLAGFMIRGVLPVREETPVVAASPEPAPPSGEPIIDTSAPVALAADAASRTGDELAVPVLFVLEAPKARKVELVGDFNGWEGSRTALVRQANTGLWTLTIPLTPGRHVYAFVVNDSVWTLDPRAAKAKDPDFGTEQSVVIVGRP
jgi:hypothetical protein